MLWAWTITVRQVRARAPLLDMQHGPREVPRRQGDADASHRVSVGYAVTQPVIRVEGVKEIKAAFKDVGRGRELTKAYKEVSKVVEGPLRSAGAGGTAQQAKAARAIKASATQTAATITLSARTVPFVAGAFLGSSRYKQFPASVGSNWQLPESGPYTMAPTMQRKMPEIQQAFSDEVLDRFRELGFDTT